MLADVAYSLDLAEDAWVRELWVHGRSILDEGSGIFAYSYDLSGDQVALRSVTTEGKDAASAGRVWNALHVWGAQNQELVAACYRSQPVQIVSFASVAGASKATERDLIATFEPHNIRDRSDKEIACEMAIAMSSVSTLAQRIRMKLGCGTGQERRVRASSANQVLPASAAWLRRSSVDARVGKMTMTKVGEAR